MQTLQISLVLAAQIWARMVHPFEASFNKIQQLNIFFVSSIVLRGPHAVMMVVLPSPSAAAAFLRGNLRALQGRRDANVIMAAIMVTTLL